MLEGVNVNVDSQEGHTNARTSPEDAAAALSPRLIPSGNEE